MIFRILSYNIGSDLKSLQETTLNPTELDYLLSHFDTPSFGTVQRLQ